jgi:hypothetical protein
MSKISVIWANWPRKKIEYINEKIPMPILSITRAPTEEERRAIREWRKKVIG